MELTQKKWLKGFSGNKKASHKRFYKGFLLQKTDENDQLYNSSSYIRTYDFVGLVLNYDKETKLATIEQRNRIFVGDEVEFLVRETVLKLLK